MSLKATMQRRARQARDRGLQCTTAVIQWQQRMAPERDDCRLLAFAEHG